MTKLDLSRRAAEIQNVFKPPSLVMSAMEVSATQFWRTQDKMLDAMQDFTEGWIQRRHEGARAAGHAARRMCAAQNPVDLLREQQEWLNGAARRLTTDCLALQEEWSKIAALWLLQMNGACKEVASANSGSNPDTTDRARAA